MNEKKKTKTKTKTKAKRKVTNGVAHVVSSFNNTIISIPLDPPGEIGQDCIKLIFNINAKCQLEVEGIDLRNNIAITSQNLGGIR